MIQGRRQISSGSPFEDIAGYSRALVVAPHVYVAGTLGVDPDLEGPPDGARAQAEASLKIIAKALQDAGSSLQEVVRVRVYLTDADDLIAVGAVLKSHFGEAKPVNTTVVSGLVAPGYLLEIEVEAILGSAPILA